MTEEILAAINQAYAESEANDTVPLMEVREAYISKAKDCKHCGGSGVKKLEAHCGCCVHEYECRDCEGTGKEQ